MVIDNIKLITDEKVSSWNSYIPSLFLELLSSTSDSIKQHIFCNTKILFSTECVEYALANLPDSQDIIAVLNSYKGEQAKLDELIEQNIKKY